MSAVIHTTDLNKIYEGVRKGQDVHALKDLNLTINNGEIFGYLGPNGSGKTTTIKMLLGLLFPTSGEIEILGRKNIGSLDIRKEMGYLPEGAYYPEFLKGEEVLRFYGQLYGLSGKDLEKRIDDSLEVVGMTKARKRYVRGYSKGMRQRIGLAQALINDPSILVLDEPTTGLDPIARKEIRDILVELRDAGKTLLISSHELLEVELISNRVGILFEGVLQTSGTLDELLMDRDMTISVTGMSDTAVEHFTAQGIICEDRLDTKAKLSVPSDKDLHNVFDLCRQNNVTIVSVAPRRETLEELFVRVVRNASE